MNFLKMFLHCYKLKIAIKYVADYDLLFWMVYNQKKYATSVYIIFMA